MNVDHIKTREFLKSQKKLVPLREDLSPSEAMIIRSTLKSAGIEAHIRTLGMASLHPGVKADIMVRGRDKIEAIDILKELEGPIISPLTPNEASDDSVICPECGSDHVIPATGRIKTLIPGLTIKAHPHERWHICQQCQCQFQNRIQRLGGISFALLWAFLLGGFTFLMLNLLNWF